MRASLELAAGLLFTGSAGYVDAIGFIKLGGAFASAMSGNTTRFGVGLVDTRLAAPWLPLLLIAVFFVSVTLGHLVLLSQPRRGEVILLASMLGALLVAVALAAAGLPPDPALLLLAAATGGQNAVLPRLGTLKLGTSYISGILVTGAEQLAKALVGKASHWEWSLHLLAWASLWIGAAFGALAELHYGIRSLLLPALVYLVFLLRFAIRPPPAGDPQAP
jgi:uncharacterized membrane protein YoaK (UPF0700 family)